MAVKTKSDFSIKIKLSNEKVIGAIKLDTIYRGYCFKGNELHLTVDVFENPLKAANAARQLEKKLKDSLTEKDTKDTGKVTKLVKKKLFTEAELRAVGQHSSMKLRFRERWVIISPRGRLYVKSPESKRDLISLTSDRNEAELFNTYEAAMYKLKVLETVIRRGHTVTRFFEDTWQ